jgi:hypothetical protein
MDALKLTWIASTLYPRPELVLCMSDPLAAAPFQSTSTSWAALALLDLGIRIDRWSSGRRHEPRWPQHRGVSTGDAQHRRGLARQPTIVADA